jgi:hypothetical protein
MIPYQDRTIQLNEFLNKKRFTLCNGCGKALALTDKPKTLIPVYSQFNMLEPGSIPKVLSDLNYIEISLIQQVKPFLKIINLKGKF